MVNNNNIDLYAIHNSSKHLVSLFYMALYIKSTSPETPGCTDTRSPDQTDNDNNLNAMMFDFIQNDLRTRVRHPRFDLVG